MPYESVGHDVHGFQHVDQTDLKNERLLPTSRTPVSFEYFPDLNSGYPDKRVEDVIEQFCILAG